MLHRLWLLAGENVRIFPISTLRILEFTLFFVFRYLDTYGEKKEVFRFSLFLVFAQCIVNAAAAAVGA